MAPATLLRNRGGTVCATFFFAARSALTYQGCAVPADVSGYRRTRRGLPGLTPLRRPRRSLAHATDLILPGSNSTAVLAADCRRHEQQIHICIMLFLLRRARMITLCDLDFALQQFTIIHCWRPAIHHHHCRPALFFLGLRILTVIAGPSATATGLIWR
jgi:hypothetical protein